MYNSANGCRKTADREKSNLLEQLYVHDVYERIAQDFEDSKYKRWPKVTEFLSQLETGSLVADIGESITKTGHVGNIKPLHISDIKPPTLVI